MILKRFKTISVFTFIVLFLLIGIGGIVHVSGSETACPDWPTCFGHGLPPTCECQLPDNYHELYKDQGYPVGVDYDPVKAWIQYLYRIMGGITILLTGITCYYGFRLRTLSKPIFWGTLSSLLLLLFEESLGALIQTSFMHLSVFTLRNVLKVFAGGWLLLSMAAGFRVNRADVIQMHSKERRILWLAIVLCGVQMLEPDLTRGQTYGISVHLLLAAGVLLSSLFVLYHCKNIRNFAIARKGILWGNAAQLLSGTSLFLSKSSQWPHVLHIWLPALITGSLIYILSYSYCKETASIADF